MAKFWLISCQSFCGNNFVTVLTRFFFQNRKTRTTKKRKKNFFAKFGEKKIWTALWDDLVLVHLSLFSISTFQKQQKLNISFWCRSLWQLPNSPIVQIKAVKLWWIGLGLTLSSTYLWCRDFNLCNKHPETLRCLDKHYHGPFGD